MTKNRTGISLYIEPVTASSTVTLAQAKRMGLLFFAPAKLPRAHGGKGSYVVVQTPAEKAKGAFSLVPITKVADSFITSNPCKMPDGTYSQVRIAGDEYVGLDKFDVGFA